MVTMANKKLFDGEEDLVICLGSDAFIGHFVKSALSGTFDVGSVHAFRAKNNVVSLDQGTLEPKEYADIFMAIMMDGYNVIGWCKNFSDAVVAKTILELLDRGIVARAYDFSNITKVSFS
jgi:hypothetical protein